MAEPTPILNQGVRYAYYYVGMPADAESLANDLPSELISKLPKWPGLHVDHAVICRGPWLPQAIEASPRTYGMQTLLIEIDKRHLALVSVCIKEGSDGKTNG